jgi:SAM-dependent methyltransferase
MHYRDNLERSIERLRAGKSNLHPVERRNLGDLHRFTSAVHLQCASGYDTLSLWLEGVQRVTGVDISDVHIENARRLSAALGAPAQWLRCDVLDVPHTLDGTADLVYTGRGALCWLHDLDAWGRVVFRLLRPGGTFHILDDHPMNWLFDVDAETYQYSGINYFTHTESSQGWPSTYIGDSLGIPVEQQSVKHERLWTLADITGAVLRAGLRLELLGEHPDPYWQLFPNLRPELVGHVPLTFSLLAVRPEA